MYENEMRFKKVTPSEELRPYVRNFWLFDVDKEDVPFSQLLFPFGSFELIINLHNAPEMEMVGGQGKFIQPESLFPGQFTKPFTLCFVQRTKCIGISLHPWMGKVLFDVPANEFTDSITTVQNIEPGLRLREKLLEAKNEADQLMIMEAYLLKKLSGVQFALDSCYIAQSVLRQPSPQRLREVVSSIGLTRRRIEQRFLESTGLSMGAFVRKVRFQKAVTLVHQNHDSSLTQIGLEAGYYDQSHFIREFKEFAGITPSDFAKQPTKMRNFVSELLVVSS